MSDGVMTMTMTKAHTHSHRVRGLVAATVLAVALAVATAPEVSRAGAAVVGGAGVTGPAGTAEATSPTAGNQAFPDGPKKKKKKKRNIISWLASVLSAPIGPPEFTAYRELATLRCERVFDRVDELKEPARTLYVGAADACLAAFSAQRSRWSGASSAYNVVAGRSGELTCMDQAALSLLSRLLAAHRAHPKRAFRRAPATKSTAPPCPDLTAATPASGPTGTTVRLTGTHLVGPVTAVVVVDSTGDGLQVDDVSTIDGALEITMPEAPPVGASATTCIVVRAAPDWDADGVLFTYTDAGVGPAAPVTCPPAPTT